MPFDATPTITEADVLRRAKALLSTEDYWWRGEKAGNRMGSVCIANAVWRFCESTKAPAYRLLLRALGLETPTQIFAWNDAPERTFADIHAALDRAIALAEAGEP